MPTDRDPKPSNMTPEQRAERVINAWQSPGGYERPRYRRGDYARNACGPRGADPPPGPEVNGPRGQLDYYRTKRLQLRTDDIR